ncbi:hypothetical protein [Pseudoxanthomonas sp. PXM02]|uniref:hypothetical protein n=1 Tax=Pseudoxanthomonas sp. PXM02 TaxID=2769294 RepID=UPI00177AC52A|nr:hypothetical protein [Pseudoxanthomonas sp. PXM02]MBD9478763.1 hypothetical protein [Pseudoxanthomonas sp. PXM02]
MNPNDDAPRDDDYLWDRNGPVDDQVARLERQLSAHRWRRAPLRQAVRTDPPPQRRLRPRVRWAMAAALAVLAVGLYGGYEHRLRWPAGQAWQIASVSGAVRVDGAPADAHATLDTGSVLETGQGAHVRVRVARIGEMVLGEGARLRLVETRSGRHRTQLEHGRLWARIWAPPGSFGIATPAGDVFDLGCEFVLDAGPQGAGSLAVRSGWVQVDNAWREVLVPQGARVDFGPGGRPGIPYDAGASAAFLSALREVDEDPAQRQPAGAAVARLIEHARPQDAISLLSLLQAHPVLAEGPVFDRLSSFLPADARVTRAAIRASGASALSPWWDALPYPRIKRWWMQWPDVFDAHADADALLQQEPAGTRSPDR